ncbi:uncharacterized protein LOC113503131 [Trichoplusia ni]|uniref:Uncharacterized protein LOC113503131 n=1 Tax=Trichoplusia ni TaxID=7111 RepID=A0A7E5WKV4_TRINI|nr:uncharacterized protein LOC113503131 [Trichoplusia ni]
MDLSKGRKDDHRRLTTPHREQSGVRRSRSRSRRSSGNRSLREREQDLERQRQRLHRMEHVLQGERDAELRMSRTKQQLRMSHRSPRANSDHREQRGDSERRGWRREDSVRRELRRDDYERRQHDADYEPRQSDRRPSRHQQRDQQGRDASVGRRSRSCSPSFSTRDIYKIIQSFKNDKSSQSFEQKAHLNNKLDYKNILPEFDPSTKNQRMDVWLKKVNECASVYGWDERTTIHFSMQKLQGLAKTWYQSLTTILYSWTEWQDKLLKAFPCEQNYGQSLEDMLRRRSRFSEPIENYFYEKLALLNQCEISGKRAVDCIIHGLTDRTAKSSALALRCSEPDQLLQFLLSNKDNFNQNTVRNKTSDHSSSADTNQQNRTNSTAGGNSSLFCYNCKEKGHPYLNCPKPILKFVNQNPKIQLQN